MSETPPGPPPAEPDPPLPGGFESYAAPGPPTDPPTDPPTWAAPPTYPVTDPLTEGPTGPPAQRHRFLPLVIGLVGAALIVVAAVAVPRALRTGDPEVTGTRTGTTIRGLQIFENLRSDHVSTDVTYPESPPAGGPHDPVWLACGVYDTPVRDENAVHDLEHGSVWIAYSPDLSDDEVAALAKLLPDNGIMAPYPDLGSPVVLTVWERQLAVDGPDDPRVKQFLEQFGAGETAPEAFVSCEGGTPDPSGGTVLQS